MSDNSGENNPAYTHGDTMPSSPYYRLYATYYSILARCYNTNNPNYPFYGGRGIVMCDEWHNSYLTFKDWSIAQHWYFEAGSGGRNKCTLDRIDNTKGYFPDNCRWTDTITQQNNKSNIRLWTYNGKTQSVARWAAELHMAKLTLYDRVMGQNWTIEEALTTPVGEKRKRIAPEEELELNGERHTYNEWAYITGLRTNCIRRRLLRGWSVEDALTTPTVPREEPCLPLI
jgi:hypothetical protein